MIVVSHMSYWGNRGGIYDLHFHNARIAVNYFFILSGFGLTYAQSDKYRNNAQKTGLYRYAFMRVKKIYPLYVTTMLIYVPWQIYTYHFNDGRDWSYTCIMTVVKVISVLPMLQSVTGRSSFTHALNSVGWFLSTLFVLYMFYPKLSEWNRKYILNRRRAIISGIVLLILYCFMAKVFLVIEERSFFDELEYCLPLIRAVPFTLGILICDNFLMDKSDGKKWAAVYEMAAVGIILGWFFTRNAVLPGKQGHVIQIGKEIIDILIAMFSVYVFSREEGFISKLLNGKILIMLGNISMYIYLIHFPVCTYIEFLFERLLLEGLYWNLFRTMLIVTITGLFIKMTLTMKERKACGFKNQ